MSLEERTSDHFLYKTYNTPAHLGPGTYFFEAKVAKVTKPVFGNKEESGLTILEKA